MPTGFGVGQSIGFVVKFGMSVALLGAWNLASEALCGRQILCF